MAILFAQEIQKGEKSIFKYGLISTHIFGTSKPNMCSTFIDVFIMDQTFI